MTMRILFLKEWPKLIMITGQVKKEINYSNDEKKWRGNFL